MVAAVESRSIARCAWFGLGALLVHGLAAWALPLPAERITPIPFAFSLVMETADNALVTQASAGLAAAAAGPMGPQGPSAAALQHPAPRPKARPIRMTADKPAPDAAPVDANTASGELTSARPSGDVDGPSIGESSSLSPAASGGMSLGRALGGGASGTASAGAGAAGGGGGATGHGPALLALDNPCSAFFPSQALVDRGEVQIDVEVDASGHPHASSVLLELPLGQGFASAARACARQLQFSPAVSQSGTPTIGHAKLKLRFKRRTA